jgi:hypothetical protein
MQWSAHARFDVRLLKPTSAGDMYDSHNVSGALSSSFRKGVLQVGLATRLDKS